MNLKPWHRLVPSCGWFCSGAHFANRSGRPLLDLRRLTAADLWQLSQIEPRPDLDPEPGQ